MLLNSTLQYEYWCVPSNLLSPPKEGNCEMDACQFLTKLKELKTLKLQVNDNHVKNDEYLLDIHLSTTNINSRYIDGLT